jgi:putative phosphoribosyl transferase
MRYADRQQAGDVLAIALETYATPAAIVLALPRGGVIVARPVAARLLAPLDVFIVRKLGAPLNPEYAIGALAEVGEPQWNDEALRYLGVTEAHQHAELEQARSEIRRRQQIYRQGRLAPEFAGRRVILVDDGIATGYTMLAAARSVRQAGAKEVIVAVPVAAPQSVVLFESVVDRVVALQTPYPFFAVGEYYTDFTQVTDAEVLAALSGAQATGNSQAPADA